MKNIIKHLITIIPLILSLVLSFVTSFNKAHADPADNPSSVSSMQYDYWFTTFPTLSDNLDTLNIIRIYADSEEIFPFAKQGNIYGLTFSGSVQLNSEISLVRIILVDVNLHEYLVYETYPLIAGGNSYSVKDVCEETCFLDKITPAKIKIQLTEASIHIEKINLYFESPVPRRDIENIRKQIKVAQDQEKIDLINAGIKRKGLRWVAGETSVSRLSYAEKRALWGDKLPNLQGAEYYKGGILEVKGQKTEDDEKTAGSPLIESFDWRRVHGANNPASPYYDGDPLGSGWLTPVKSQGCNHCWAFAPLHATEALVNLYFNQHIDLDLSEQDVASCSGGEIGCCRGGYPHVALDYIINTGVVDEACFPYSSNCLLCSEKCMSPSSHIKIAGKFSPSYDEESLKRAILTHGPIAAGLWSWWHIMVLVGFEKDIEDDSTVWKFKNSWGTGWGDNGYGYLKVERSNLYNVYVLYGPITSLVNQFEIACLDEDEDGFYNWGISSVRPPSCPPDSPSERDCDDFNPLYGPINENGHCMVIGEGYTLTVETPGIDSGTVTSFPLGIHCGNHCSRLLATGTSVTLTVTANSGYAFRQWSGDATGTDNPITVTMDRDKTVTAEFVLIPETISTPETPTGPDSGSTGDSYSFTTGGSTTSFGHDVQYFFDWEDGTNSEWLPVGTTSASKSWNSPGTYGVKVQARCAIDTPVVSDWSSILPVTISAPETVSIPTTLNGATSGTTGTSYTYSTGGSTSSLGHPVEYQFDWKGDATDLSAWGSTSQSKTWSTAGTYIVRARARCAVDTSVISGWSSALTVNITVPETVSAPTILSGPAKGITGVSYTYSTGGSLSNFGHPLEYQFDWGDGNLSDWSASTTALKSWSSPGVYSVRSQARCVTHPSIISGWSSELIANITNPISLRSPSEGTYFGACSLYGLPTFRWDAGESFRIYEIQFSPLGDFSSVPVSIRVFVATTEALMRLFMWKNVLSIPGTSGGTVYWRVVGTRANRTRATSEIRSIIVEPAQEVTNPTLSSTSKSIVPILSWENNCNIKFKIWFGSDINFTKKTTYTFNLRNPSENEGKFTRQLAPGQWNAIRRVVGDVSGATIYGYVESWDGLGRYNRTDVMDFVLID